MISVKMAFGKRMHLFKILFLLTEELISSYHGDYFVIMVDLDSDR